LKAEAVFTEIAEADPAARAYVTKCRQLMDHPTDPWQGVWVITSK
jgi:hypothetical protein